MFLNGKRPPTVTRKVVVQVKKTDESRRTSTSAPTKSGRASKPLKPKNKPLSSLNRPSRSSPSDSRDSTPSSISRSRAPKRKAPPSSAPFSSGDDTDDDDDDDADDEGNGAGNGGGGNSSGLDLLARKRLRPSPGALPGSQDIRRNMFRLARPRSDELQGYRYRSSASLTGSSKGYRVIFEVDGKPATVKLRYPSHYPRERYPFYPLHPCLRKR
jgi:hypothetical protein